MIERIHAADAIGEWCRGRFHEIPDRFVGLGHPSAPQGWPVHDCLTCGEPLFIDYPEPVVPGVNAPASQAEATA